MPPGVFNVVPGDRDVGEALVGHPGVDKVSFTGSTAAGRQVAMACAEGLKQVSLELGGKSAAIVLDDADPASSLPPSGPRAWPTAARCATRSAASWYRPGGRGVRRRAGRRDAGDGSGDPSDPATQLGPLVAQRQQHACAATSRRAVARAHGSSSAAPSMPDGLEPGWYVKPTLFSDADNGMRIAREEIFGPVLTVIPYDTEERRAHRERLGLRPGRLGVHR